MHIVSVFLLCLQDKIQEDKEEQLNFILPGCLIPYQKEIKRLFEVVGDTPGYGKK